MVIKVRARAKQHLLMPGETISAVIKKFNQYDATKEEMENLIEQFKKMNTDEVKKPGMSVMVPVLPRHQAAILGQK